MFDGQGELIALTAQIEIRVSPTMQFTGTAQGLAGAQGGSVFFSVMDQEHGQMKLALELTQEAEQGRDLRGLVLIALMQADEWIQNQQQRSEGFHGRDQTLAIQNYVQAQGSGGDDVQGELGQGNLGGSGDAIEPSAHDAQGVLGGKHQDRTAAPNWEASQAGSTGSHRQSEV